MIEVHPNTCYEECGDGFFNSAGSSHLERNGDKSVCLNGRKMNGVNLQKNLIARIFQEESTADDRHIAHILNGNFTSHRLVEINPMVPIASLVIINHQRGNFQLRSVQLDCFRLAYGIIIEDYRHLDNRIMVSRRKIIHFKEEIRRIVQCVVRGNGWNRQRKLSAWTIISHK